MPKFLIEGSYTSEGLRGLAKEKASRRQAVLNERSKIDRRKTGGHLLRAW
jgi:hypothetical protein